MEIISKIEHGALKQVHIDFPTLESELRYVVEGEVRLIRAAAPSMPCGWQLRDISIPLVVPG